MTLAILVALAAAGQAQEKLKVGDLKDGKLVITNLKALQGFLMTSIGKSGTLGKNYQVNYSPEGDRMFVFYPVTGNAKNITNTGVMLVAANNEVFIAAGSPVNSSGPGGGGSFEITCMGSCPTCMPNIRWVSGYWLPVVYCECTQGEQGECTMVSKITIHVNVGF